MQKQNRQVQSVASHHRLALDRRKDGATNEDHRFRSEMQSSAWTFLIYVALHAADRKGCLCIVYMRDSVNLQLKEKSGTVIAFLQPQQQMDRLSFVL